MIALQTDSDGFLIAGTVLHVSVTVDPEVTRGLAGIAGIEEGPGAAQRWITHRYVHGDRSDRGRAIIMRPEQQAALLRVKLWRIAWRP